MLIMSMDFFVHAVLDSCLLLGALRANNHVAAVSEIGLHGRRLRLPLG